MVYIIYKMSENNNKKNLPFPEARMMSSNSFVSLLVDFQERKGANGADLRC